MAATCSTCRPSGRPEWSSRRATISRSSSIPRHPRPLRPPRCSPPTTPTLPALLTADDSGVPGDGITNITRPHVVGTASANVTIQLINAAGTVIGSASTGASASYSVSPSSPLVDGSYVLHVQATDQA